MKAGLPNPPLRLNAGRIRVYKSPASLLHRSQEGAMSPNINADVCHPTVIWPRGPKVTRSVHYHYWPRPGLIPTNALLCAFAYSLLLPPKVGRNTHSALAVCLHVLPRCVVIKYDRSGVAPVLRELPAVFSRLHYFGQYQRTNAQDRGVLPTDYPTEMEP